MNSTEKASELLNVLGKLEDTTKYPVASSIVNEGLYNEYLKKIDDLAGVIKIEEEKKESLTPTERDMMYADSVSRKAILAKAGLDIQREQDLNAFIKDEDKYLKSYLEQYQESFDATNNLNRNSYVNQTVINEQLEEIAKQKLKFTVTKNLISDSYKEFAEQKRISERYKEFAEQKRILDEQKLRNKMFAPASPFEVPAGLNINTPTVPINVKVSCCSRDYGSLKACRADGSITNGKCVDKTCKYYIMDSENSIKKQVQTLEQFNATKKRKFGDFE